MKITAIQLGWVIRRTGLRTNSDSRVVDTYWARGESAWGGMPQNQVKRIHGCTIELNIEGCSSAEVYRNLRPLTGFIPEIRPDRESDLLACIPWLNRPGLPRMLMCNDPVERTTSVNRLRSLTMIGAERALMERFHTTTFINSDIYMPLDMPEDLPQTPVGEVDGCSWNLFQGVELVTSWILEELAKGRSFKHNPQTERRMRKKRPKPPRTHAEDRREVWT